MPMQYPPLSDGTFRYGDPPRPLPSPVPGPDPDGPPPGPWSGGPPGFGAHSPGPHGPGPHAPGPHSPGPHAPGTYGDAGFGTPPSTDPGTGRPSGVRTALAIGGVAGAVVVVALALAVFGPDTDRGGPVPTAAPTLPSAPAAPPRAPGVGAFPVSGTFMVTADADEPVTGDADGCDLPPTMTDIGEGTRIELLDPRRNPIDSAPLVYDHGDGGSCTFTFGYDAVPAGEPYYVIEVPGRGQLVYTERELREGVDVTLGR